MIVIDHSSLRPEQSTRLLTSRRRLLLAGLGTLGSTVASGCISPSMKLMGAPFGKSGSVLGGGGYTLSNEQINAIPYASIGLRIGNSGPVVMILASINGQNLHWASADRVVLITERGRLVKTIGMSRDLIGTRWTGSDSLLPALRREAGADQPRVSRIIDLRPKDDYSVPVESRCDWIGEETLTLLGQSHQTVVLRERVRVEKWRWKTENRYWFEVGTGKMLKSRQQYCPEVLPITMEVLKPVAEPSSAAA